MGRSKAKYQCPHCESTMVIRTSKLMHPLSRLLYLQCKNASCGFSCCANFEITHQLSPSAIPNTEIQLKTLSEIKAERQAQMMHFNRCENIEL